MIIGTVPCTISTYISSTSALCLTAPARDGSILPVYIRVGGQISAASTTVFRFLVPVPTILSVQPSTGEASWRIIITKTFVGI